MEIGCKMLKIFYLTVFIIIITNFIKIQYERTYETEKHTNVQNLQNLRKFSKSVQSKKLKVSITQENSIAFLEILTSKNISPNLKMSFNSKNSTSSDQSANVNRANFNRSSANTTSNGSTGFQNQIQVTQTRSMQNTGNPQEYGNQTMAATGISATTTQSAAGGSSSSESVVISYYGRNLNTKTGTSIPQTSRFISNHGIDRNSPAGQFVQQAQRPDQRSNDTNEFTQLMGYKQAESIILEHLNARKFTSAAVSFIFMDIIREAGSALPAWLNQHKIDDEIDNRAEQFQANISRRSQGNVGNDSRPARQEREQPTDNLDTNTVIQNYHALLSDEVQSGGTPEEIQSSVIECIMEVTEIATMRTATLPTDIDTMIAEVASMILAGTLQRPHAPRFWTSYKPAQEDKAEYYPAVFGLVLGIDRVGIHAARMTEAVIEKFSESNGELAQMISDQQLLKDVINTESDLDLETRRNSKPFPTEPGSKKDLAPVKISDRVVRYIFPNQPQPTINAAVEHNMRLEERATQMGAVVVGGFLRSTSIRGILDDISSIMNEAQLRWNEAMVQEGLEFPENHPHNPTKVHEHPITGVFSVVVWLIPSCKCAARCGVCSNSTNPLDIKLFMPESGIPIPQRPIAFSGRFFSCKGRLRPSESKGGNDYARPYMVSAVTSIAQLPEHSDNVL